VSATPPRKLTRSAEAERKRIRAIFDQAVSETGWTILSSGWTGFTPAERRKQKAKAEVFKLATACLRRALDETEPGQIEAEAA
jgi:hypothetical protein